VWEKTTRVATSQSCNDVEAGIVLGPWGTRDNVWAAFEGRDCAGEAGGCVGRGAR
jgi:hypothetical protein